MSENAINSGSGKPTDSEPTAKERLEMMWNLSKAARDRFNVRNETEWKICLGLWTAFGAAAGLVFNSSSKAGQPEVAGTTLIVVLLVYVFYRWTVTRRKFDEQDSQTAYYWESAIENQIGAELHTSLRPKTGKESWLRVGEGGKTGPIHDWKHPGLWGEVTVSALLGLLVIGAVGSAACRTGGITVSELLYSLAIGAVGSVLVVGLAWLASRIKKTTVSIDTKNSNTVDIEKMKVGPKQ